MKLLLALFLCLPLLCQTVEVKELSKTQTAALVKAKAALDAAQRDYDAVQQRVLAAYDIDPRPPMATTADCFRRSVRYEFIADRWLVIRWITEYVCWGDPGTLVEPIK